MQSPVGNLPMTDSIDILLATYQGSAYLPEQLDSLFAQTCQDWRLVARDDGSTDATRDILERASAMHPGRVVVLPADGRRLGASASFSFLLERSEARYVMFCDQDDVWLPDKVATTLAAIRDLERTHGAETPLLVNTDLKVVDHELSVLDDSFWHFQRIHPERLHRLSRVLVQNFATGCTTMVNRPLVALALPVPAEAMMHDWWLALVATRFGKASPLPRATVLYRQHGRNDIGASRWSFLAGVEGFFLYRERRRAAIAEQDRVYGALGRQALAFAKRYGDRLSAAERAMIAALGTLRDRGFFGRRYLMLRYALLQSDRWQAFMGLLR
jgi:glycosyltransferase involved in cell wall biosynthesis